MFGRFDLAAEKISGRKARVELICAWRCSFPPSSQGFDQRNVVGWMGFRKVEEGGLLMGVEWIEPAKRCRVEK